MKKNIIKIASSCLAALLMLTMVISCNNDDEPTGGNFNITELQSLLTDAQSLLESTDEGINAGDQQPGSKATLQSVINWIQGRIVSSESQADISDASVKLQAAIATYQQSVVSTAFPWVQHGVGSGIELSNNVKQTIYAGSTMEMEIYIVDLNQAGFSNNLFGTEDFPAVGMSARYFGNGVIELVTGIGNAWPTSPPSAPGTMKSGEWVNVAFTNSGSTQQLFINGELIGTLNATPATNDKPWILGNSPTFNDRSSNVLFREFKVWNSVLDQATIQSNINTQVTGSEAGLEVYFPFGSDLGPTFSDIIGNSTATLQGNTEWVPEPPVILLEYATLDAAIQELTTFRTTVNEGDQDGDFPIGTLEFIDGLLTTSADVRETETRQTALDGQAATITRTIGLINDNLVADADGIFVDSEDPSSVGLRITPNYNPTGDYTYELDLRLSTFFLPTGDLGIGDIFGNGSVGLRVNGYIGDLTEEKLLNSGGGWNFTNIEGVGFTGPMFPPLTLRSGVWQHVAVVHDNTARTTSIYVDGEMIVQQTDIGAPVPSGFAETWLGNTFGFKITGDIKDFRIWEEARTPAELNMEITGDEPNLITYFPLDRVKGLSFVDDTDSGEFNGEMRGVIWNTPGN